jgi:hypothetical protein
VCARVLYRDELEKASSAEGEGEEGSVRTQRRRRGM